MQRYADPRRLTLGTRVSLRRRREMTSKDLTLPTERRPLAPPYPADAKFVRLWFHVKNRYGGNQKIVRVKRPCLVWQPKDLTQE